MALTAVVPAQPEMHGLTGVSAAAADVMSSAGELGVGALALLETVFPPVPSEIVLSLAGYLAQRQVLDLALVLLAAVAGAVLGNLALYAVGRWYGPQRSARLLARLPLISERDVTAAQTWFDRHGRTSVLFGRFVPLVRAFVSIPAGATRMPLATFLIYTTVGIGVWNSFLVGAGYLLGTQYQRVEQYLGYLDHALLAAAVALAVVAGRRWWQRRGVGVERRPAA